MQHNNDILKDITKELFIQWLKDGIRSSYPQQIAEIYCKQVDDMNHFAKLLEEMRKG